jgi:hypothetical protein
LFDTEVKASGHGRFPGWLVLRSFSNNDGSKRQRKCPFAPRI